MSQALNFADLMAKQTNDKSIWQQSKGIFNDTTEIVSEVAEGTAEIAKALRKTMNLLNFQLDEMIITSKIALVAKLMSTDMTEEQAIAVVLQQTSN